MGKKILAVWVFLIIAIVTVGYLFFIQEKLRLAADELARVQEVLSLIYDAQGNLSDAEAITRGYILTGDEGQLATFQQALRDLGLALERLNRMTANEPEPQRLLGELNLLIGRRQALLQVAIDLRRLKGQEVPEHVIMTREGTKVQNEIRQTFDQLETYGKNLLQPGRVKEHRETQSWLWILTFGVFSSFTLLLCSMYFLNREINERKRAEEKLAGYQEHLRSLSSQLSLAEERERRRIAVLLHDQIAQSLTMATIRLRELQKSTAFPAAGPMAQELDGIGLLLEQVIRDTQSLTFKISPPILYELGLEAALEWLTEQLAKEHGLATAFESDHRAQVPDHDLGILLFQAVNELLVNVVKHARAASVKVSMTQQDGSLRIQVRR